MKAGWTIGDIETSMQKMLTEFETGYPKFSFKWVSAWAVKK